MATTHQTRSEVPILNHPYIFGYILTSKYIINLSFKKKKSFHFQFFSSKKRSLSPINGKSVVQQKSFSKKKEATVNQHPTTHDEGWMVSGQETVFCRVPAP
jgi:hypothetical protein